MRLVFVHFFFARGGAYGEPLVVSVRIVKWPETREAFITDQDQITVRKKEKGRKNPLCFADVQKRKIYKKK